MERHNLSEQPDDDIVLKDFKTIWRQDTNKLYLESEQPLGGRFAVEEQIVDIVTTHQHIEFPAQFADFLSLQRR